MKTWILLALLASVFVLLGAGLGVGGVVSQTGALIGVGAIFFVVGVVMAVAVPKTRREQLIGDAPMAVVEPRPVTAATTPWPYEDLAAELARVFADTPYVVEGNAERLRVRADLADARFLTFGGVRRVKELAAVDVLRKGEGQAVTVSTFLGTDWTAGPNGSGVPRLTGKARAFTGKSWSWGRRIEYGVGADGELGRQVDYTFSSRDLNGPISEVLKRAGWRERWPMEARGALVMVCIGASAIVIVPVAFLIRWLLR